MVDLRTEETYDYSKKKDLGHSEIMLPANAPKWASKREVLWQQVELFETRRNSQTARQIVAALPRELNQEQNIELVRSFARKEFTSKGMAADVNFHEMSLNKNPHVHIGLTTREFDGDSFAKKKNRDWNKKELLKQWRQSWQEHVNQALQDAGANERIDCRSWKDKGEGDRIPQIHLGTAAHAMMKRGVETEKLKLYRAIEAANQEMEAQRAIALADQEQVKQREEAQKIKAKAQQIKAKQQEINKKWKEAEEAGEKQQQKPVNQERKKLIKAALSIASYRKPEPVKETKKSLLRKTLDFLNKDVTELFTTEESQKEVVKEIPKTEKPKLKSHPVDSISRIPRSYKSKIFANQIDRKKKDFEYLNQEFAKSDVELRFRFQGDELTIDSLAVYPKKNLFKATHKIHYWQIDYDHINDQAKELILKHIEKLLSKKSEKKKVKDKPKKQEIAKPQNEQQVTRSYRPKKSKGFGR